MIFAIDPSHLSIGWACVDISPLRLIGAGCIKVPKELSKGDRLLCVERKIKGLLQEYDPVTVAIEMPFFDPKISTALDVQHTIGVILLAVASTCGYEPQCYHQSQVKAAVARGGASKAQVREGVERVYGINSQGISEHAIDALAVCVAALNKKPVRV